MTVKKRKRKKYKFRTHVGPVIVGEVTRRLKDRGILANAGTEHVYGEISADSKEDAAGRLNRAAKFKLMQYPDLITEKR